MDDRNLIAYVADVHDKEEATIKNMSGSSYATLWLEKASKERTVSPWRVLIPPVTPRCLAESSVSNPATQRNIYH